MLLALALVVLAIVVQMAVPWCCMVRSKALMLFVLSSLVADYAVGGLLSIGGRRATGGSRQRLSRLVQKLEEMRERDLASTFS